MIRMVMYILLFIFAILKRIYLQEMRETLIPTKQVQRSNQNIETKTTQQYKRTSSNFEQDILQASRLPRKKPHTCQHNQRQQQKLQKNTVENIYSQKNKNDYQEQIRNELKNKKQLWQKQGSYKKESIIQKYSEEQQKNIDDFIKDFITRKERKYQTNLPLFKNQQNNKMQEQFCYTLPKQNKQTKNELHDDMFFPEFSISKKDNCRNKWVFYIFGLTLQLKNLDLNSKPLKTKILIDKSSYSKKQVDIVSKSCISQHVNTLSNHRNGLHVRNHKIFDGIQQKTALQMQNQTIGDRLCIKQRILIKYTIILLIWRYLLTTINNNIKQIQILGQRVLRQKSNKQTKEFIFVVVYNSKANKYQAIAKSINYQSITNKIKKQMMMSRTIMYHKFVCRLIWYLRILRLCFIFLTKQSIIS